MKAFIHTTAQFDIRVPGSRSLPDVKNWYNFLYKWVGVIHLGGEVETLCGRCPPLLRHEFFN
jgi:hypothetical protein